MTIVLKTTKSAKRMIEAAKRHFRGMPHEAIVAELRAEWDMPNMLKLRHGLWSGDCNASDVECDFYCNAVYNEFALYVRNN